MFVCPATVHRNCVACHDDVADGGGRETRPARHRAKPRAAQKPGQCGARYLKHATDAAVVFKEFGALQVVESWGDDVPEGQLTSFPMAVKREAGEAVMSTG